GDRHPLGRAIAAARDGVEAEKGGAGVCHLVQLREMVRVAGKREQLRAGKAVGDVHRPARESVEALWIVGLDLDVDAAHLGSRTPVIGERAEMQAAAAIPLIEVVWAAPR